MLQFGRKKKLIDTAGRTERLLVSLVLLLSAELLYVLTFSTVSVIGYLYFIPPLMAAGLFWGPYGGLVLALLSSIGILLSSVPDSFATPDGEHLLFVALWVFFGTLFGSYTKLRSLLERGYKEELPAKDSKNIKEYRCLFNNNPVAMYKTRASGEIVEVNTAFVKLFGFPDYKTAVSSNAKVLYTDPEDRRQLIEDLKKEKMVQNRELLLKRYDGGVIIALLTGHLIEAAEDGDCMEGSILDVTELKHGQVEQQKRRSIEEHDRQMSAVARLAAGAAHDLNNIHAGISGHAQVIRMKTEECPEIGKSVTRILEGIDRASRTVHKLLSADGEQRINLSPTSINSFVAAEIQQIQSEDKIRHPIRLALCDRPTEVMLDHNLTREALYEILKNAAEATGNGEEEIIVSTEVYPPGSDLSYSALSDPEENCAAVAVIDSGRGLSDEEQNRIFSPYTTSHTFGEGSGFGLTKVFGIMRRHGGAIEVDSRKGGGTTVVLYFPLQRSKQEQEYMEE